MWSKAVILIWVSTAAIAVAGNTVALPAQDRSVERQAEFRTGSVRANGLAFHYLEAGQGPLVLALHGFPDSPRTFRSQMRALAASGYRVVAPFMRGYAPTDVPEGPYRSPVLVQDALALIDALSSQPVVLMGHDWGAVAAHGAAAVAPEKVAKLITMAVPHGGTMSRAFVSNAAQQRRSWYIFFLQMPYAEAAVARDDFAFIEALWRDWSPGWALPPEEMEAVKTVFRQPGVLQAAMKYYRHTFGAPTSFPEFDSLARRASEPIRVPTLYFHGARDGALGAELTAGMESAYPGGLVKHVLEGAGHFVHQEKAAEVNQLILTFLRR
jgi:pimeloyl-ACP methyl ester carboxylesterase